VVYTRAAAVCRPTCSPARAPEALIIDNDYLDFTTTSSCISDRVSHSVPKHAHALPFSDAYQSRPNAIAPTAYILITASRHDSAYAFTHTFVLVASAIFTRASLAPAANLILVSLYPLKSRCFQVSLGVGVNLEGIQVFSDVEHCIHMVADCSDFQT
jgi:hypothetical protein